MPGALSFLDNFDNAALLNVVDTKYPDAKPYQNPSFFTVGMLIQIIPEAPWGSPQQLVDIFNELAPAYGLNSARVFPEYIAECAHESASFTKFEENLNYQAARLMAVWPRRFPDLATANRYAHNPQQLANNVYANRMGNGDTASGDGWRYRGSGALQMTGKGMYRQYAAYKGRTDIETMAEEIRTNLRTAIDSSMWVFVVNKKLLDEAESNHFDAITNAINGGNVGDASRKAFYTRALAAMPEN